MGLVRVEGGDERLGRAASCAAARTLLAAGCESKPIGWGPRLIVDIDVDIRTTKTVSVRFRLDRLGMPGTPHDAVFSIARPAAASDEVPQGIESAVTEGVFRASFAHSGRFRATRCIQDGWRGSHAR
ncbi:MAG: hypothetical protein NT080_05940 [Spirochaetes bacterium]|nr:hypothetical protein [Spirochaetota bacterium]